MVVTTKEMEKTKMHTPGYIYDIRAGKYLVDNAIDKILKECNIDAYPIDVIQIAQKLNFKVYSTKFSSNDIFGVMYDGTIPFNGEPHDKRFIAVNADDSPEKKLFTIAHELGHFIQHCNDNNNFYERYRSKENNPDYVQKKKFEDQADFFATNILLPGTILRKYIYIHKSLGPQKLKEKICHDFLVEPETVQKRFEELEIRF